MIKTTSFPKIFSSPASEEERKFIRNPVRCIIKTLYNKNRGHIAPRTRIRINLLRFATQIFRNDVLVFLALLLICLPANADDATHFQFDGTIVHGQSFTHALPENLYFHLVPIEDDFEIRINKTPEINRPPNNNFAGITLPLHGLNSTFILGHEFDKRDNGPALLADGPDYAFHEFKFALSEKDMDTVYQHYYNCISQLNKKCKKLRPFPERMGYATLTITDYQFDHPATPNEIAPEDAEIESMSFTVSGDYHPPRSPLD